MSVGPPPARPVFRASLVAFQHATGSKPSTRIDGIPYAAAFSAIVRVAVCRVTGVEIAHWLLVQKKIVGVLNTAAKFIASWKSPSEVAPSPNHASDAAQSPLILA